MLSTRGLGFPEQKRRIELCVHCDRICVTELTIDGVLQKHKYRTLSNRARKGEFRKLEKLYKNRRVMTYFQLREQACRFG